MNKIDRIAKSELLPMMEKYHGLNVFKEIIPISALENDGTDFVKAALIRYLPEGEPFYPADTLTEQPERFFVGEIIREKIFLNYAKEIPYSTDVQIEEFKERPDSKDFIRAVIFVEHDSQKKILIGKKGEALKRIGETARKDIETFLDRKVYLELWVKVKEEWRRDKKMLKHLGYM
jgi:GTP-binding protein Era